MIDRIETSADVVGRRSFFVPSWVSRSHVIAWSLVGLLLGVGFVLPHLWVVSLLGGAYFFWLLKAGASLQQVVLGAWLAWGVKSLLVTSWFWSTYPIEWLPLAPGSGQVFLIFLYWFTAAIWLGSGGALVALALWLVRKIPKVAPDQVFFLAAPFLWVVGELCSAVVFSVFTLGPGGTINTFFSFGYLGYLLAESDLLLWFAKIAGVYSLSFLFVLLSLLAFGALKQVSYVRYAFLCVLLILYGSSVTASVTETLPTTGERVVVVETSFPSRLALSVEGQEATRSALEEAVVAALAVAPDHIILPEDVRFFDQSLPPNAAKRLYTFFHGNPAASLLDTGRVETEAGAVLQAFFYNGPEQRVEQFQKRYLVPQGEYIPILYGGILKLLGGPQLGEKIDGISYVVGPLTSQSAVAANLPGVLFCFESADPVGVQRLLKEREQVPFVAHPVSHSWFHEPQVLWHQFNVMLQVQAAWSGVYIVSAANQATSHVYTPAGGVLTAPVIAAGDRWRLREVYLPVVR